MSANFFLVLYNPVCEGAYTDTPSFTKTTAMKDLLAERARLRQGKNKDDLPPTEKPAIKVAQNNTGEAGTTKERDLGALVQSVKRRMEQNGAQMKSGRKRHRK